MVTKAAQAADVHDAVSAVEGLLDDDGQYNPNPDEISRGHPDYDHDNPESREKPRDERGRFKADKNADEDDSQEQDFEETDVEEDVETEQEDDVEVEEDTDDDDVSEDEDAESVEADTDEIQSLQDMASALEVPIEELKASINHTFNAAGEEVTVTLAEMEKGYARDSDYRRKSTELAEQRRAFESDARTRYQNFEQDHVVTSQVLQAATNLVAQEFNDPALAELRETDPAEWTARREELGQKHAYLQQVGQQAAASYANMQETFKKELTKRESALLLEAIPNFGAEHKNTAAKTMESLGYTQEEISNLYDSRMVRGLLELSELRQKVTEYEARSQKAKEKVKEVKKGVPPMQKPGKASGPTGKGRATKKRLAQNRHRLKRSGSLKDAASVIADITDL